MSEDKGLAEFAEHVGDITEEFRLLIARQQVEGKPAQPGKPIETQTRDELLYAYRQLASAVVQIAEARVIDIANDPDHIRNLAKVALNQTDKRS